MIRKGYVLGLCACVGGMWGWPVSAHAQGPGKAGGIRTVQLTLAPAPEAEQALQYRLDTPYFDQQPGNGALLYETAVSLLGEFISEDWAQLQDKITQWHKADPATLPMDEVRSQLSRFRTAIHYLDLASRSEECVWNSSIRQEGLRWVMPNLAGYRTLFRVLALKARAAMAEGDMPDAIRTLRIGVSMARGIGNGPIAIQAIVGIGIANGMLSEIERLIQRPDAPNLYWALTSLPTPLIDTRRALEMEAAMIYAEIPQFRDMETRALSEAELADVWGKLRSLAGGRPEETVTAAMLAGTMRLYPVAKADLERGGKTAQEIEALPASQAVLIYQLRQYRRVLDGASKWNYVPAWQVGERNRTAEKSVFLDEWRAGQGPVADAFWGMFPNPGSFRSVQARLERGIAMLRCVEALRIYAAGHQGRLPQSLDEVTEVPIPLDPLHGRGFQYHLTGDKAAMESPARPGRPTSEGLRYEITLRPAQDGARTSR